MNSESKSGAVFYFTSSKLKPTNAVAGMFGFTQHRSDQDKPSHHLRKGLVELAAHPQAVEQYG